MWLRDIGLRLSVYDLPHISVAMIGLARECIRITTLRVDEVVELMSDQG